MRNIYHHPIIRGLSVEIKEGKPFEKMFRQFCKSVQESGLLKEVKDRMYFETNPEKRRRRAKMARKRWLKKIEGEDQRRQPVSRKKIKKR